MKQHQSTKRGERLTAGAATQYSAVLHNRFFPGTAIVSIQWPQRQRRGSNRLWRSARLGAESSVNRLKIILSSLFSPVS